MLSSEELRALTDDEMYQLRVLVIGEEDRRRRLASAPAQVADIARSYAEDGGDTSALVDVIANPPAPLVEPPIVEAPG